VYKKSASFVPQLKAVQSFIGLLPVNQMKVDMLEADGVIAMLSRKLGDHYKKVIISCDKDFIQLVDD
jgi:5'-3' exonuclease